MEQVLDIARQAGLPPSVLWPLIVLVGLLLLVPQLQQLLPLRRTVWLERQRLELTKLHLEVERLRRETGSEDEELPYVRLGARSTEMTSQPLQYTSGLVGAMVAGILQGLPLLTIDLVEGQLVVSLLFLGGGVLLGMGLTMAMLKHVRTGNAPAAVLGLVITLAAFGLVVSIARTVFSYT